MKYRNNEKSFEEPTEHLISMIDNLYDKPELEIKTGDKVTWTNNDEGVHTVTSSSGNELNSGDMSPGQTYSKVFNNVGTYEYYCEYHQTDMIGSIIVI